MTLGKQAATMPSQEGAIGLARILPKRLGKKRKETFKRSFSKNCAGLERQSIKSHFNREYDWGV